MIASTVRVTPLGSGVSICPEGWDDLPRDLTSAVAIVVGGSVLIDPLHPDQGMGAELHDVVAAAWWVEGVFGEAVAEAALAGGSTDPVKVEVGSLDAPLRRFAMAWWLLRWWPSRAEGQGVKGLDELLLVAEVGEAAWNAEPCLPDPDIGAGLLTEGASAVARAAAKVADLSGAELDVASARLWPIARAVVAEGDPGTVEWRAVADLVAAEAESTAAVAETLSSLEQFLASPVAPPALAPALVAGGGDTDGQWWQTVDWAQVMPRHVGAGDGNVLITHEAVEGGTRMVVQVKPGDAVSRDGLNARVYRKDGRLPIALIPLAANSNGYLGAATVKADADEILVDVFESAFVGQPRWGAEAARDRARVQAIVTDRLASPLAAPLGPFLCELLADG